jgi:hypothetical protein
MSWASMLPFASDARLGESPDESGAGCAKCNSRVPLQQHFAGQSVEVYVHAAFASQ